MTCYFQSLLKKCRFLELFWFVFSRIRTEYGEIRSITPYSIRIRENTYQNNSEYGYFLRSESPIVCSFWRIVFPFLTVYNSAKVVSHSAGATPSAIIWLIRSVVISTLASPAAFTISDPTPDNHSLFILHGTDWFFWPCLCLLSEILR